MISTRRAPDQELAASWLHRGVTAGLATCAAPMEAIPGDAGEHKGLSRVMPTRSVQAPEKFILRQLLNLGCESGVTPGRMPRALVDMASALLLFALCGCGECGSEARSHEWGRWRVSEWQSKQEKSCTNCGYIVRREIQAR